MQPKSDIEVVYDMTGIEGTSMSDVIAALAFCNEAREVLERALNDAGEETWADVEMTPGRATFRFGVTDPTRAVATIMTATRETRFAALRSIGFGPGYASAA